MTTDAAPVHSDPGLQPERTTLSWTRTSAVLIADVLLFVRAAPGSPVVVASIGAVCLALPLLVLGTARRDHGTRVHRFAAGVAAPALGWNLLLTATVLVLTCGAAALVVTR